MQRTLGRVAALAALMISSTAMASPSVMTVAPDDSRAVTVRGVGDGVAVFVTVVVAVGDGV